MRFTKDFIFGTATSSYQIEGAYQDGGRTDSIWDIFSKTKENILDNSNGDIACNHYHQYLEDIELIKQLETTSYRFSISWSRIMPRKGEINQEGIQFYRNLCSILKKSGLHTMATIYHWDMPLWIYNENKGWIHPDTVNYFIEYSKVIFEALDDVVDMWVTLNEPHCSAALGYLWGEHAPGHKNYEEFIKANHYLLLAHGKVVQLYKKLYGCKPIGISLNPTTVYTLDNSLKNQLAKNNSDGIRNRLFYDPLFKGSYPLDIINLLSRYIKDWSFVEESDLSIISTPIDFLGVNFYNRDLVEYDASSPLLFKGANKTKKVTSMNWEITPEALRDAIIRIRNEYTNIPIYITENGSSWDDQVIDGKINDQERINYLNQHLKLISDLNEVGMNIKGYYIWSLLDNFEWAFGYTKRFGLIYVDYQTLKRIPKESYYHYRKIIRNRGL